MGKLANHSVPQDYNITIDQEDTFTHQPNEMICSDPNDMGDDDFFDFEEDEDLYHFIPQELPAAMGVGEAGPGRLTGSVRCSIASSRKTMIPQLKMFM